ncbi:MAG: glycosyltransferase family 4 protein [Phycisphaerales bacterium JB063]
MRILAVNYEYPPLGGGGGVILRDIVEELASRGHEMTVLTSGFKDLKPVEQFGANIEVHRVPVLMRKELPTASMPSMLSFWPLGVKYGKKLIRQKQFDIVNSHFLVPSGPVGAKLAKLAGVPDVLSIHGGDIYDPTKKHSPHRHWVLRKLGRKLLLGADEVIGPSHDIMNNARKYYVPGFEFKNHIPLGIKPTTMLQTSRAEFEIEEDRFVMITTGRLVERKKVGDMIRVLAKMDDPRDLLIVLGDGPKKAEWEQLARDLGVAERVQFRGYVSHEDKCKLTQLADAYTSTSTHEGFGLVFVEAMDRGVPVVSFDRGGHVDYLVDGETGGVAPLGDLDAFAKRAMMLKNDDAFRAKCSAHVKEKAKLYHIAVCAGRYEALFERTIAGAGQSQPTSPPATQDPAQSHAA